ncbi:MAG: glycosyl transferase family 2 [Alphaproteobacteria bacterium]|nr:glycosyl transferase family 2 [Alphaproteobacteria bacterium]
MNQPLITIITVVKDSPRDLLATAQSIMDQDPAALRRLEWIVINGSDRVETKQVMEGLGDYITIGVNEADTGIFNAMNKAIDLAQGKYLWSVNAGDVLKTPQTASVLVQELEGHPETDLLYAGCTNKHGYRPPIRAAKTYRIPASHQATLYNRALVGDQRYQEQYKIAADLQFGVEFGRKSKNILYLDQPIAHFQGGGVSDIKYMQSTRECFQIRQREGGISLLENIGVTAFELAFRMTRRHFPKAYGQAYKAFGPRAP